MAIAGPVGQSVKVRGPRFDANPATYFRSPSTDSRKAIVSYMYWQKYEHFGIINYVGTM